MTASKIFVINNSTIFIGVCHTVSLCSGFLQFANHRCQIAIVSCSNQQKAEHIGQTFMFSIIYSVRFDKERLSDNTTDADEDFFLKGNTSHKTIFCLHYTTNNIVV